MEQMLHLPKECIFHYEHFVLPTNKVNMDESASKLSYRELAEKIVNMERIGQMPSMASNVNLAALKDGCNDLASSLFKHQASIHKNCRAKINERVQQRVQSKEEDTAVMLDILVMYKIHFHARQS